MTKWASIVAGEFRAGPAECVTSLIILTELATGTAAAWRSWTAGGSHAARTAAMTAVAATFPARDRWPGTIGFIGYRGSGAEPSRLPSPAPCPASAHARVYGRRAGLERGLRRGGCGKPGWRPWVVEDPRAAVEGCEVVVATVPAQAGLPPFLEPARVAPGGFVGRRRSRPPLAAEARLRQDFDLMITDDHRQSEGRLRGGRQALPHAGPFDADLGDFITGRHPGRR